MNILTSFIIIIIIFIIGRVCEYRLKLKECENFNNKYREK